MTEERAVESRRVADGDDLCMRESGWACANIESVARVMGRSTDGAPMQVG